MRSTPFDPDNDTLTRTVGPVLRQQNLGVLATMGGEYPYTSLVGFAVAGDMRSLVFATMKGTRKYDNLKKHPRVSLLVNSATNNVDDFKDAASITVLGKAADAAGDEAQELKGIFLSKFPVLTDFVNDPSCSLVKLSVERFIVVTRFQEVKEIEV